MRTMVLGIAVLSLGAPYAHAVGNAGVGKAVYERACKTCHGATGQANPDIAKMMRAEIKDLRSPAVQNLSDAQLKKIITEGKGNMPPVRSVTGKTVDDVIAFVRTLKK